MRAADFLTTAALVAFGLGARRVELALPGNSKWLPRLITGIGNVAFALSNEVRNPGEGHLL